MYQQPSTSNDSAMIGVINHQSFTNLAYKTAAAVCCSARPHAKAFVHAAAAAARPKKSASSQIKQQQTLSTGLSLHTVATAAVHQLSSLPAVHSQQCSPGDALDHFKQRSNWFSDVAAGPLHLAGQLRVNPSKRGHLAFGPSMQVLWYAWSSWLDGLFGRSKDELEQSMRSYEPR